MKTKLSTLIIVFTIFSTFNSCEECKTNCEDPINTYNTSGHQISIEDSKILYNNYKNRFRDSIEAIQKRDILRKDSIFNATQYVLVNIDYLRCYLDFLEEVEKKNGSGDKDITALAIFFGARGENALWSSKTGYLNDIAREEIHKSNNNDDGNIRLPENNIDIRGRTTMFMAPTYRSKSNSIPSEPQRHIPFYIIPDNKDIDPYIGKYGNLLEYFESNNTTEAQLFTLKNNNRDDENNITTLNSEEFTDMPPKKPIIIGGN